MSGQTNRWGEQHQTSAVAIETREPLVFTNGAEGALGKANSGVSDELSRQCRAPSSSREEALYKVAEIAADWKMSTDKVQQLFLDAYFSGESGILVTMGKPGRWKVNRRMLRITESARFRMYRRLQTRSTTAA
jgi:hypothetical protein